MDTKAQLVQGPTDWLIGAVCKWIENDHNNGHVREAMRSSGGWEVWLQLELLFALRPQTENLQGKLERERTHIWEQNPIDRIDFWFTWNGQQDPNGELLQRWGLELKCRTNAESHDTFSVRLHGDINKCTQKPATAQTALYVIAISHDREDIKDFNQWYAEHTYYTEVPLGGQSPIYVIWWKIIPKK